MAMFAAADLGDISFFELDKLFTESARTLRRRHRRRRQKERQLKQTLEGGDAGCARSRSRSRTPPLRRSRFGGRELPATGGFSSKVERVERTVVVTGVPTTADERAYVKHFVLCGTIIDVKIIRNRADKPTGVVVIEFADEEAVGKACTLAPPFNEMMGMVPQVKRGDAQMKKDTAPKRMSRAQVTQQVLSGLRTSGASTGEVASPNLRKLHIKNLKPVVTEEDMRGIFKPFAAGDFEKFEMGDQECWITYESNHDAQDAMTAMQGFTLVGQELQISMLTVEQAPQPQPPQPPQPPMPPAQEQPESMDLQADTDFSGTARPSGSSATQNRLELMGKLLTSHTTRQQASDV